MSDLKLQVNFEDPHIGWMRSKAASFRKGVIPSSDSSNGAVKVTPEEIEEFLVSLGYTIYSGLWCISGSRVIRGVRTINVDGEKVELFVECSLYSPHYDDDVRVPEQPKGFLNFSVQGSTTFKDSLSIHKFIQCRERWDGGLEEKVYRINLHEYHLNPNELKIERCDLATDTRNIGEIDDDLYPGLNMEALAQAYLRSQESLLFWVGEPGTGKTCAMKRIMQAWAHKHKHRVTAAYVKDIRVLRRQEFWSMLSQGHYNFLLLDDMDKALTPREKLDKGDPDFNIVENMLSYSNGIIPCPTKIMASSNSDALEIDNALLRPGRCFDILRLPPLSMKSAEEFWEKKFKLPGELFDRALELRDNSGLPSSDRDHMTQAELMSLKAEAERFGQIRDYLRDPAISVRYTYGTPTPSTQFTKRKSKV